jgi:uncharacterized membrane protein
MDYAILAIGDPWETWVYGAGAGLILPLVFWVGSLAGLALLIVLAIRRARVRAATVPSSTGQPTAKEILQAQYARGEITREQYELRKQEV